MVDFFLNHRVSTSIASWIAEHRVGASVAGAIALAIAGSHVLKTVAIRQLIKPHSAKTLDGFYQAYMDRRQKQINLAISLGERVSADRQTEIIALSGLAIARAIKDRHFTCQEVLITFAFRAATIGVELNLLCDINVTEALLQAQEKDELLAATADPKTLPIFFGVPITVKEHLSVKGLLSCCGYKALTTKAVSSKDCVFVDILREAGAIPFAQTNVPQGLFAIESHNYVYGQAKNPHNIKLTVGGSSGGEAGAQAARISAFGVGSDSLGSARIPAAFCGVYSFKGTGKRVSVWGRLGVTGSEYGSMDGITTSIGPMSAYLEDIIAIERQVLGRFHAKDMISPPLFWNEKLFEETSLQTIRVGLIRSDGMCANVPAINNVLDEVVTKLQAENVNIVTIDEGIIKRLFETIAKIFATPGVQMVIFKTLKGEEPIDLHKPFIETGLSSSIYNRMKIMMKELKGERRVAQILKLNQPQTHMQHMMLSFQLDVIKKEFQKMLVDNNIDVIVSPVLPFTAIRHGDGGDLLSFIGLAGVANALDLPAGVLPIRKVLASEADPEGYVDGFNDLYTSHIKAAISLSENMPVAIQVSGLPWEDEKCLKILSEIDRLFQKQSIQ